MEPSLDLKPVNDGHNPLATLLKDLTSRIIPDLTQMANDPYLDYLAMTITAGLDVESYCPPYDIAQYRRDFLAYTEAAVNMLGAPLSVTDSQAILLQEAAKGDERSFRKAATRGSRNKRFFWTLKGEFGVGPKAAQAGDIIVLLYGANAPSILRPKETYYQYVGECYLHKYMHGEPIEMVIGGLLVAEDFDLK